MYSLKEATARVQEFIDFQNMLYQQMYGVDLKIGILDEYTKEYDSIWLFSYDSTTDDDSHKLMGKSPLIVEKETLDIYSTLNFLTLEENLALYYEGSERIEKVEKDENGLWAVSYPNNE